MRVSLACSLRNVGCAVILATVTAAEAAEPPALVISGAAVFDSRQGKMLPEHTLVIEGDRIRTVTRQEAKVPPGARAIDGRGKFVIPGLIDAHVHLVHGLVYAHVTGDEVLPLYLANGVTTLRDVGDEVVAEKLLARFADAHPERCPRIFLCSPLLDGEPPYHKDIGRGVARPEDVPALVEDLAAWGVTTLKIYVRTERPVGRKIIEEGHRRGLVVTGHLGNYSAQDAVSDGIDCLEHITSVFGYAVPPEDAKRPGHRADLDLNNPRARALIAQLARGKVMVDPTLVVFRNMILLPDRPEIVRHPDNRLMPRRLKQYWPAYLGRIGLPRGNPELREKEFRKYQELTGLLFKAGVPLLVGSDAPEPFVPPGFSLHQELELLVESGLPPAAALQAATLHNARALKQEERLGSIEPGKLADLVLLDADPLADIRNTRKIYRVIRGGRVCDPAELLKLVPGK